MPRTPTAIAEEGERRVGPALSLSLGPFAARAERASHADRRAVGCESGCIDQAAYVESSGPARSVGRDVHKSVRAGAWSRAKPGLCLAADAALAFKDLKLLASAPGHRPACRRDRDRAGDRRVTDRLLLDAARPGTRVSRGGTVRRTAGQLLGDRGRARRLGRSGGARASTGPRPRHVRASTSLAPGWMPRPGSCSPAAASLSIRSG